jgi:predicted DNA-binding transcriptional regulator AlpA
MEKRFVSLKDLEATTPYSRSTIWLKISRGKFPQPLKLPGVRGAHWLVAEVNAHLDALVSQVRGSSPEAHRHEGA